MKSYGKCNNCVFKVIAIIDDRRTQILSKNIHKCINRTCFITKGTDKIFNRSFKEYIPLTDYLKNLRKKYKCDT